MNRFINFRNSKDIHFSAICKRTLAVSLVFLVIFAVQGQRRNTTYTDYIARYKDLAIRHQQQYGVPASITLAQGLLESAAGQSYLARNGNNHFGIKCHSSWGGGAILVGNSAMCYRQYDSPEQSFEDHARFLKGRRYASLYDLDVTDYKGWARGLRAAGYAEDPAYAGKLIDLIEAYELYRYDQGQPLVAKKKDLRPDESIDHDPGDHSGNTRKNLLAKAFIHDLHSKWGLYYIRANANATIESIATEFGKTPKQILEFNDFPSTMTAPAEGEIVYLVRKKDVAPLGYERYTVPLTQPLHEIAQQFGIKLKALAKMNKLAEDATVARGTVLRLR